MATQTQVPTTDVAPDPFRGLHPIFRDCAGDDGRFSLARPWRDGGFVYATNGAIVVRVPVTSLGPDVDRNVLEPGERRVPMELASYFTGTFQDDPFDLPDVGPADRRCLFCEGAGTIKEKTCTSCHGGGCCTCDCNHRHACGCCDGTGVIPSHDCEGCDGSGKGRPEPKGVKVADGVRLDRHWIAVLREYGAVVHLPIKPDPFKGVRETSPLRFTIGPIEGRVCRMSEPN